MGTVGKKLRNIGDTITDKRRYMKTHFPVKSVREANKIKEQERQADLIAAFQEMQLDDILGMEDDPNYKEEQLEAPKGLVQKTVDFGKKVLENDYANMVSDYAAMATDFAPDGSSAGSNTFGLVNDYVDTYNQVKDIFDSDNLFESAGRNAERVLRAGAGAAQLGADVAGFVPGADIVGNSIQIGASTLHGAAETTALVENAKDIYRINKLQKSGEYEQQSRALKFSERRAKSDSIESAKELSKDVVNVAASSGAILTDAASATVGAVDAGKLVGLGKSLLTRGIDRIGKMVKKNYDRQGDKEVVTEMMKEGMAKKGLKLEGSFSEIRDEGIKIAQRKSKKHNKFTKRETERALGTITTGHDAKAKGLHMMADMGRVKETKKLLDMNSPESEHNIDALEAMGFVNIRKITRLIAEKNKKLPDNQKIPTTIKFPANYRVAQKMGFSGSEDEFKELMTPLSVLKARETAASEDKEPATPFKKGIKPSEAAPKIVIGNNRTPKAEEEKPKITIGNNRTPKPIGPAKNMIIGNNRSPKPEAPAPKITIGNNRTPKAAAPSPSPKITIGNNRTPKAEAPATPSPKITIGNNRTPKPSTPAQRIMIGNNRKPKA